MHPLFTDVTALYSKRDKFFASLACLMVYTWKMRTFGNVRGFLEGKDFFYGFPFAAE